MKIAHFSDLHLDTKFESLNNIKDLPQKRRLEQRKALKKVIEYIQENEIEILLIPGDLYEQKYIRKTSIDYINNLFKQIPETQIFIAPGNHDPYLKNSFYATYEWSPNVHIFKDKIEKIDYKNIHIYGYGFTDYYCKETIIEDIQVQEPEDINILVVHGSLDGGRDELRQYNPLRSHKLKQLQFEYIALGHIHKPYYKEEKNQKIIYPGSLISLGFDELGKHGMIIGNIEKEKNQIQFIAIDTREYIEIELDITDNNSNEEIIEKIQTLKLQEENLYKIILTGERNFQINKDEIKKLIEIDNIVKIKDHTKIGIDIEKLKQENNIKGIFIKNILERQKQENLDDDIIEKAIELGLEVLQ